MISARIPSSSVVATAFVAALFALLTGASDAQMWGSSEKITGSGVSKTETRSVSGFHDVVLGVHAKLKVRQGASEGMSITGDDNIVPLIETVVENGSLKIRWVNRRSISTSYKDLEIAVDARNIDALTIAGSGQIGVERLKAAGLRADINGSGTISFDALDAESLVADIRGSGSLSAAGRVDSLDVTVSGSGRLSAAKLESRRAKISMLGSGQATVWAKEDLSTTIAGSGKVDYYGTPRVSQSVAGSGRIRQAGAS